MSEYSDIEQLWERRNYEEKEKGLIGFLKNMVK